MNKYQEALNTLREKGYTNHFQPITLEYQYFKEFKILQELVDKATPKKTKAKMNEHNHIERRCPICNGFVYSFDKYCGRCGQALDGNDENE